jgi:hypothetical protein
MLDTFSSDPSSSEAEGLDEGMLNVGHALDQASCDQAASTTLAPTGLPVLTASTGLPVLTASTVLGLSPGVVRWLAYDDGLLERADTVLPAKRSLIPEILDSPKQTRRRKSKKDPLEVAAAEVAKAAATAIATAAVAAKAAAREVIKVAAAAATAIAREERKAISKAAAEEARAAATAIAREAREARIGKDKTASRKKGEDAKSAGVAASTARLPPRRMQSTASKAAAIIATHAAALADAAARDEQADAEALAAFDAAQVDAAAAADVKRGSAFAFPTTETAKVARARVSEAQADL